MGKPADFTVPRFEKACLTAVRSVSEKKWGTVAIALPVIETASSEGQKPPSATDLVQTIALAGVVGSLGQGIYKAEPSRFPIENLVIAVPASADSTKDRGGRAPRANPGRSDERRPRAGQPPGSGHLSGNLRPAGQGTRSGLRAQLRRLRRGLAQAAANGLPAGRRPGKRAAAAVCRPRIRRSRRRKSAARLRRQGSHLRQRRTLHQAHRRHAHHEVRHGGVRHRLGSDDRHRPAQAARQCLGLHGPRGKHDQRQFVQAGRRVDRPHGHHDRGQQHRCRGTPRPGRRLELRRRRGVRLPRSTWRPSPALASSPWETRSPASSPTTNPGATRSWRRPNGPGKTSGNCRCSITLPSSSKATWPT